MWHIAALCYGLVSGVVLAQWWNGASWWLIIASIPLISLAFWQRRRILLILTLGAGLLIGLARGSSDQALFQLIAPTDHTTVYITVTALDR